VVVAISKVGAFAVFTSVAVTMNAVSTGKKSKPLNCFKSFFFKGDLEASL
jgi:hypothetical protein